MEPPNLKNKLIVSQRIRSRDVPEEDFSHGKAFEWKPADETTV